MVLQESSKLLLPSIVWLILVPLIILLNVYLNGSYDSIAKHLTEEQAQYFIIVYVVVAGVVVYGEF